MEISLKFRTSHLPSRGVGEPRDDRRPFARVMYAGRLSIESGDDLAPREKFAWELLNTSGGEGYDEPFTVKRERFAKNRGSLFDQK
jgi:hypothetical protein